VVLLTLLLFVLVIWFFNRRIARIDNSVKTGIIVLGIKDCQEIDKTIAKPYSASPTKTIQL